MDTDIKNLLGNDIIVELGQLYNDITGLDLSFIQYDEKQRSFDCLFDFFWDGSCEYCKYIKSSKLGLEKCRCSDLIAFLKVQKTKKPYIYKCYAGLTEILTPLTHDGRVIGLLQSGACHDTKPKEVHFENIWPQVKHLKLNKQEMLKKFLLVKILSRKKREWITHLFFIITNFVIEKKIKMSLETIIREQQQQLFKDAEQKAHLRKKLSNLLPFATLDELANKSESRIARLIKEAKIFIDSNYREPLTLDIVSEAVNLSPSYFGTMFKQYMNATFCDYLRDVRIENAKKFLLNPVLNISTISKLVGFSDPNYFSTVFKKSTDLSPTDYREQFEKIETLVNLQLTSTSESVLSEKVKSSDPSTTTRTS